MSSMIQHERKALTSLIMLMCRYSLTHCSKVHLQTILKNYD